MAYEALRVIATTSCPHCRGMVAINRLDAAAFCDACGRELPIAPETWRDLLRAAIVAAPAMAAHTTSSATAHGVTLQYRRVPLGCLTCGRSVDFAKGRCEPCGTELAWRGTETTPYAGAMPEIACLYGEAPPRGAPVKGPIAEYPCEGCGAALRLESNEQLISCAFCGRNTHVPLRFLYRGHRDIPEPWALAFKYELAPIDGAALVSHLAWTGIPDVFPLGEGAALLAGERRITTKDRDGGHHHRDERFLLALSAGEGLVPRILWSRNDLVLATGSERRPYRLSSGSARLLVRTHAGIYILDARTGDTLNVLSVEAKEGDAFASVTLELPGDDRARIFKHELRTASGGERFKKVTNAQTLSVGDATHFLTGQVKDGKPQKLIVRWVNVSGAIDAQGEAQLHGEENDARSLMVSSGGGKVWACLGVQRAFVATIGQKLRFEKVKLPVQRGEGTLVALGDGLARISTGGGLRCFDATGALVFDANTLR